MGWGGSLSLIFCHCLQNDAALASGVREQFLWDQAICKGMEKCQSEKISSDNLELLLNVTVGTPKAGIMVSCMTRRCTQPCS